MKKKKTSAAVLLAVLTILYIILIKTIDVAPIGPLETKVGWSHINGAVHELTGMNMFWYRLTNVMGICSIITGLGFACAGIVQLIRRKKLSRVDRPILGMGGVIICLAVIYVLFEKVVINCRPVIMPGEELPEASFPSSHTMLFATIIGCVCILLKYYIKDDAKRRPVVIILNVLIVICVLGRLLSGVHWLTDIIGGVLFSMVMLTAYAAFLEKT